MSVFSEMELSEFYARWNPEDEETFKNMIAELSESVLKKLNTTHTVKPRRAPVESSRRCFARKWGGGVGTQCGFARMGDSDYCKTCAAKAAVTRQPCCFAEGKQCGLHWGDTREEVPFRAEDGSIAIVWKSSEIKEKIIEAMNAGAGYHPSSKEGKSGKTSPPRIAGKKTKKAKTASVRGKNAFLFFVGDGNRSKFMQLLKDFYAHTGKHPNTTFRYLVECDLDLDAAKTMFDDKVDGDEWNEMIRDNSWESNGDFDKELRGTLITGPTSKLAGAVWNNLSDEEKSPYEKMAKEDKAKKLAAALAKETDVETSEILETDTPVKKKTKKTKKTKKSKKERRADAAQKAAALAQAAAAAALAAEDSDDETDDETDDESGVDVEEQTLANGKKVLKDECGTCYDPETNHELGMWDEDTNTVV